MAQPYLELLTKKIKSLDLSTSPEVLLECKHFFSGAALYANGKISASLTPSGFGLKLPADVRNCLIEAGEAGGLRYFEKAPVKKEYVVLSKSIVEDTQKLKSFINLSIGYVKERDEKR